MGDNIAASLGHSEARAYRHKDLGVVADLVGVKAGAKPLGIELTGLPAKAVAGGYGAALVRCRDDRSPQPVPPRQRPSCPRYVPRSMSMSSHRHSVRCVMMTK